MRIAVISDTHSQYNAVERAVQEIDEANVELTIHCGDITDSETVWLFQPNTHFVWGNCDAEKTSLRQAMHGIGATCHEYVGQLELAGQKIAFVHGDDEELLGDLRHSEQFDLLFHGHTHTIADRRHGPTRVINPGAFQRVRAKTFALLDLTSSDLETVTIAD